MFDWLKNIFGGKGKAEGLVETPFQIRGAVISARPANLATVERDWHKQRKSVKGQLIVLVDGGPHEDIINDQLGVDPTEIINDALCIDVLKFLADRRDDLDLDEDAEDPGFAGKLDRPDPSTLAAYYPPRSNFIGLGGAKSADLAVIPCEQPWQVFAYVPFGNWNDVPQDSEITAVLKSWYERFGAIPALVSSDVIEFWVERPITSPEVAADVALEMLHFCPDVVYQCEDSTQVLANSILRASTWYFWWD